MVDEWLEELLGSENIFLVPADENTAYSADGELKEQLLNS